MPLNNDKENKHTILIMLLPVLLAALILQLIRLPGFFGDNRPDFMVLALLYFAAIINIRLKIELAWLAGLVLDLLNGSPLGINALLYAAQIYIIGTQFRNFASYAVWQQAIIIGLVNILVNIIGYWLEHIIGQTYYAINFVIPGILMALLWFPVYFICNISSISLGIISPVKK